MTPIETVQAFLRALESLDLERILALSDPSIVYENVSLPPARGAAEFEKHIRMFGRVLDGFGVETHAIAATGSTVLTERIDILRIKGVDVAFWVCGTFEVRNGRITVWRDYFDWRLLTLRLAAALPKIAIKSVTSLASTSSRAVQTASAAAPRGLDSVERVS